MEAGNVEYRPITFSCYGRPHPDAVRLLRAFSRQLARRKGTEAHVEERGIAARIGVQIWRRAARMLQQCLPAASQDEAGEMEQPPLAPAVLWRVGRPDTIKPEAVTTTASP